MDDIHNIAKPKPIERFAVDVNVAVTDAVEMTRPQGLQVNVAVEAHCANEPLIMDGDRFALGRVYRNLITNAIQATPAGGRVTATTARVGDSVQITVTDTGSGIPADRLPKIFDDFVTTKRQGLGLGLAISKRIVEQLDGTIAVESEVGRGTSFTLRFPMRDGRSSQAAASWSRREESEMFRTLVKTEAVAIENRSYPVRYFEVRTNRGLRRYSAEILLGPDDRVILDGDSVINLEARATRLVPATLYSRRLARSA